MWLDDKVMQIVSLAVTDCVILCPNAITRSHHGFLADHSNSLHTTGNVFVVPSSFIVADCHPNSHTSATLSHPFIVVHFQVVDVPSKAITYLDSFPGLKTNNA